MPNELLTGMIWSSSLPSWQRNYYSLLLLETLRTKSIMVPFCTVKRDFAAAKSGIVTYTEVFDTEPNWNALAETNPWLSGTALDSRTINIALEIHGDMLKFSDYNEIVQYVNAGNTRGLVSDKIGQNQKDYMDILARNAHLAHPNPIYAGGSKASRILIGATDIFDPDLAELARTHLEEAEVPGVAAVEDGEGATIVCVTTPRVVHDIRTAAGSKWLEVQMYNGAQKKFSSEVGMWNGVRFVKTNRNVLRNYGAVTAQNTLAAATVVGQGAATTVDGIYAVGQSGSVRYITMVSALDTSFTPGAYITIHSVAVGSAGDPPIEGDGTQETRRIVAIDAGAKKLVLDKPLLKPHAIGDYVTVGRTLHASMFMGGPSVVEGIGEDPQALFPPKIDDMQMVNRYGWRGFLKFQMFRPEYLELHLTAGTTD